MTPDQARQGRQLGSTSAVTNASGTVVGTQGYYPFGGTRYTSGTLFTDRLYTGQQQIAGLGLYNYKARYYDPLLGRFISPDTVTPGGISGLNRYSYVGNSPINRVDPSGHSPVCVMGGPGGCLWWAGLTGTNAAAGLEQYNNDTDANLAMYHTSVNGSSTEKNETGKAAMVSGNKFAQHLGTSPQAAFYQIHGDISVNFGSGGKGCITNNQGGSSAIECGSYTIDNLEQNILHEFGHAFDNHFDYLTKEFASNDIPHEWNRDEGGYMCNQQPCMMHSDYEFPSLDHGLNEEFGDMYMNWVLEGNTAFPQNGFDLTVDLGEKRSRYMNGNPW